MAEDETGPDESGQVETVTGTARDAKAGAALVADDGRTMYVEGKSSWDEGVSGRRVTLTGVVRRKQIYPQPRQVGGMTTQGMTGTPLVIRLTEPFEGPD
jgi:hypothetical protein